jgi:NAD(P)-dependent dehydrogenase (short-subunit alcohol dehydrogenase family)
MPRLQLEGASAIVTGGASGIGEAAARQLADLGVHVVIADLNEEMSGSDIQFGADRATSIHNGRGAGATVRTVRLSHWENSWRAPLQPSRAQSNF